jgi:uncharacterized membrane protein YvlD (DUF360 family)
MHYIKKITLLILVNAGIFWALSAHFFTGKFEITGGWFGFVFVALVFGILNFFLHPVLTILSFPIRILTLGISSLFLNGILLWCLEKSINFLEIAEISISIDSFLTYVLAGIAIAILNTIFGWLLK